MSRTTTKGLFRLPRELRFRIYEEVLSGKAIHYSSRSIDRKCLMFDEEPRAGLVLASKQIFAETIDMYCGTSSFRFDDVCRLLDWSRTIKWSCGTKPASIFLVMNVDVTDDAVCEYIRKKREEEQEEQDGTYGEFEVSEATNLISSKPISEADKSRARESILKTAKNHLRDDINLVSEKVPQFKSATIGELHTVEEEGEVPQLHAAVTPQSIVTKRHNRISDDAQHEQVLKRWGPFDDPFLDTTPGPDGLSRRTKALAKLCGYEFPKRKPQAEDEQAGSIVEEVRSRAHSDPFVDTPPSNKDMKRTDSAIELCEPGGKPTERSIVCIRPPPEKLSPIKKVYPRSLVWKDAVVPKFEPSPIGRIWC